MKAQQRSQEHEPTSVSNNCSTIDIAKHVLQNWNIDGAAKHLFIAAVNCITIFSV